MLKMNRLFLALIFFSFVAVFSCSRYPDNVVNALELAGDNRYELEKVLEYFADNPDTLKYRAAVFLIENMPYHFTQEGKDMETVDSAYLAMSKYPKEQRDKVFKELTKNLDYSTNKIAIDIRTLKADYIIKAINDACDLWHEVTWHKEYSTSLFFDYVLPYRLLDEPTSEWREAIKKIYPYLTSNEIRSKRGIEMEVESLKLTSCEASNKVGASNDRYVLLAKEGATVSFDFSAVTPIRKNIVFRYTTANRHTKIVVNINGVVVDTIRLDPTNDMNTFKVSRVGTELKLRRGTNHISINYAGDSLGLDYVRMCAIEDYDVKKTIDYSSSFCQIKNAKNGYYITFDTLRSALLNIMEVRPLMKNDSAQMIRMDYLGYPCWSISAFRKDTIDLCMEVQYVRTNPDAPMSQYKFINGNNQKWVIIPIDDEFCKIMSKDTGLFLDIKKDAKTGRIILVQNPYINRSSQKWKIERKGSNLNSNSIFTFGSSISEALRVFDVMGEFEWVGASAGPAPKAASLINARTGNCRDEASYTVQLCRSLGIPAAIDFTPHWGNRSLSHQWSVLILPSGKSTPFYMGCTPGDTAQYFHSYLKPKIFRYRFQLNKHIAKDMKNERSVPMLFQAPNFIDVTEEYYETTDVTIDVPEKYRNKNVAYICVFDNRDWVPVHYGNIEKSGKVTFLKMGRNIMYMSAVYEKGKVIPFGDPFCLKSDGKVETIHANERTYCTLNLVRKYPFMGKEDFFNLRMLQGQFQGSNKSDFSSTTDLLYFNEVTNGNWYEFLVTNTGKYRYLRYKGPNGSYCNINELAFFDEKGDSIKGDIIGTQGVDWGVKEKVFDGNILTGFEGNSPDGHWVGLKLKSPTQVSKLRFIPRNDGNCIEIGDKYELMYWKNGIWKVLAIVTAKDNVLSLKKIPSGGLYVLRNLTKGHEERIFTYEDNKQVWW